MNRKVSFISLNPLRASATKPPGGGSTPTVGTRCMRWHLFARLIEEDYNEICGGLHRAEGLELRGESAGSSGASHNSMMAARQTFFQPATHLLRLTARERGAWITHQHERVVRMEDVARHRHEREARGALVSANEDGPNVSAPRRACNATGTRNHRGMNELT